MDERLKLAFDLDAAQAAADLWGFNCGPGAIAAVLHMTPDALRPHLLDFEKKHYTNPRLMYAILNSLGINWWKVETNEPPLWGLARVQWEGPWTEDGAHWSLRQRHTHWIGCYADGKTNDWLIFDVNAVCVGGWIPLWEWRWQLVPWLLRQCEPEANGKWHLTHCIEIARAATQTAE